MKTALGGTVNDVVLATVSSGFRDLLVERGEQVEGRTNTAMVPVSLRVPAERGGETGNRVANVHALLPLGHTDPCSRPTPQRLLHACSSSPVMIAGCLGKSDRFDRAIAEFAQRYASQNDADFAACTQAIADGAIPARFGVGATRAPLQSECPWGYPVTTEEDSIMFLSALSMFRNLGRAVRHAAREEGFLAVALSALILIAIGTFVYTVGEGWSIVDGFYFAVATLTTSSIADPDLVLTDPWIKVFTAFYIVIGIGILVEVVRRLGFGFVAILHEDRLKVRDAHDRLHTKVRETHDRLRPAADDAEDPGSP